MALIISSKIRAKLVEKHSVSKDEVEQCFTTREGKYLIDKREEHLTDPPSQWFIAETYYGRTLKVVFVMDGDNIFIKTAYEANEIEIGIYKRCAK